MYRFLVTPRWIAGLLVTLLAAGVMVRLGFWQLDRLHQRQERNAAISTARSADPRAAGELIPAAPDRAPSPRAEWTRVAITGSYDADGTILIRQRTFDEGVGFEVVVPLHGDDGVTYLVDRGYVLTEAEADQVPEIPAPPSGVVTVTGSVKRFYSASGAATRVERVDGHRSVRALSPTVLSEALGYQLAGGYIQAVEEQPAAGESITRIPFPALDDGPHLSYAVQWWLFALLTVGGFAYLARRESIELLLAEEYPDDEHEDGVLQNA